MTPKPRSVRTGTQSSTLRLIHLDVRGQSSTDHLRLTLNEGIVARIGRAVRDGQPITWDVAISREHADVCWENGRLRITCLPTARNPILFRQETTREIFLSPGDCFRIGKTTFTIVPPEHPIDSFDNTEEIDSSELPPSQQRLHSFSANDLRRVGFRHAEQQLEYLAQLPELISEAQSDASLSRTLCGLLLDAIPHAEAVAVAHYDPDQLPALTEAEQLQNEFPKPLSMHVQTREDFSSVFQPSRSMIVKTLHTQESVLHIWNADSQAANFTFSEGLGWALCSPVRGDSSGGWCMYVSGKGSREGGLYISTDALKADLRFTELVAQFIGSVRQVRALQEQRSKLNSFFSPNVIDGLTSGTGPDALEPAERNVTVLFCDVRGFSRRAEMLQDDLFKLLASVRAALGVMVDSILERDGSIADFQGDAAMGFWGWPVALEYGPIEACRAAINIQNVFGQQSAEHGSLLEGFSVGIGIAHGRAIAGQIGTQQQSKIGVFGPVVNQCARLESMTKQFGVSICIDAATAEFVERCFSPDDGRIRPLARVRPQGMQNAIDVYNLLPPESVFPEVNGQTIASQQLAHQAIIDGRWNDAALAFSHIPDTDGPKQFLLQQISAIRETTMDEWDGVVPLSVK